MPSFNPTFTNEELQSETWKEIPDFPDYEASTLGRIRRKTKRTCGKSGHILVGSQRGDYRTTTIYINGKPCTFAVHAVIARTFHGVRPEEYEIDHVDTNKLNNRASNLEYVTKTENCKRAKERRLHASGERQHSARFTQSQIEDMLRLIQDGWGDYDLAPLFGVDPKYVWRVRHKKTWKYVIL